MNQQLTRSSKLLSLILRHKPEVIGLSLDAEGWVEVADLLVAATAHNKPLDRALLDEVVFSCDKQRFAFSPDGLRIRANQGHSLQVDLGLQAVAPPAQLYHGTVERFLPAIHADGLQKMQRQHVHLSATVETAERVGARRGKPIVLVVDAAAMQADGHAFFLAANGVWLTESVPPTYLGG